MVRQLRQEEVVRDEMQSQIDLISPKEFAEQRHTDIKELRQKTLAWTEAVLDAQTWKKVIILRIILDQFLYGGSNEVANISKLDVKTVDGQKKWQQYLQLIYPGLLNREWNRIRPGKIDGTVGEMIDQELLEFAHQAKMKGLAEDLLDGLDLVGPILEGFRQVVGPGLADSFMEYLQFRQKKNPANLPGSDFDDR